MNWYNDNDPRAAAWLRELIKAGHIAPGVVDERSISEIKPDELREYNQCHFFAGIGGWSYALRLAGIGDDDRFWTASLPCQPFSGAGAQEGAGDDRHLWPIFYRLVAECAPQRIVGEQVARAIGFNWLDGISADLEKTGHAVVSCVLGAHSVGAPHIRQRIYWFADTKRNKQPGKESYCRTIRRMGRGGKSFPWNESWQSALSRFRVVGDGLPRMVGATDGARNAIVPQVAAVFLEAAIETMREAKGAMESGGVE